MPEQTTKPDSKSYHNGVQDATIINLGDAVGEIKSDMKEGFGVLGTKIDTFQNDITKIKTTARIAYIIGGVIAVLLTIGATITAAFIGK